MEKKFGDLTLREIVEIENKRCPVSSCKECREKHSADYAVCQLDIDYDIDKLDLDEVVEVDDIDKLDSSEALKDLDEINVCLETKEDEDNWERQHDTIKQCLLKLNFLEKEIDRLENQCLDVLSENIRLTNNPKKAEKENIILKEIIKSFFDKGCPLNLYIDRKFGWTIQVDDECSIMHLGEYKGVDLMKKLKEVLEENEQQIN